MTNDSAFQHLMPGNVCFGCGPTNPHGLQIESVWDGDESVCRFQPEAHHTAAPSHFVNGGILATVIDCHAVCTASADAARLEGRPLDSRPLIAYATGSLHIEYLRPTPIGAELEVRARIVERDDARTRLACSVFAAGKECARAEVEAVRVPESWMTGDAGQDVGR